MVDQPKADRCTPGDAGRFWRGLLLVVVTWDVGKTKSTPSPTDLD